MGSLELIINAFWFFLPAGIANMAPVFACRLPLLRDWKAPMDFGKKYRGKRIFGANKTWRGLAGGVLAGGVTGLLVQSLIVHGGISPAMAFITGCIMGCGALVGDAVESFVKRQRDIPPGQSWFPFDQVDYIIGGLVFVYPVALLSVLAISVIFVMYFGLHIITSYIGYLMGLKPHPI